LLDIQRYIATDGVGQKIAGRTLLTASHSFLKSCRLLRRSMERALPFINRSSAALTTELSPTSLARHLQFRPLQRWFLRQR
jgi:hypothetical protein